MKLLMLSKQLLRFVEFGITRGDIRLGREAEEVEMGLERAVRVIEDWVERQGEREIAEGEISVRPHLPRCWDGNAK
jgi:hypothetical protein